MSTPHPITPHPVTPARWPELAEHHLAAHQQPGDVLETLRQVLAEIELAIWPVAMRHLFTARVPAVWRLIGLSETVCELLHAARTVEQTQMAAVALQLALDSTIQSDLGDYGPVAWARARAMVAYASRVVSR